MVASGLNDSSRDTENGDGKDDGGVNLVRVIESQATRCKAEDVKSLETLVDDEFDQIFSLYVDEVLIEKSIAESDLFGGQWT